MSEPIPESVPTSMSRLSSRPLKRRALSPTSTHAATVSQLFAHPERDIVIPPSATSSSRRTAAPPEIVANVQGSSAGAGSGEFHVYKASRRREYERLRVMDEEVRKEEQGAEFEKKREQERKKDQEKTERNRKKREKRKGRAKGKGGKEEEGGKMAGVEAGGGKSGHKNGDGVDWWGEWSGG